LADSGARPAIFGGRWRENLNPINDACSQIACSVDLPPFFDDASWRRLIRIMFLRFNRRFKDGKEHRYWNIVE
jgi:hypothetical protein